MSDLIVIAFDDEADAFSMRQELIKAQGEYLVELEDAVVVTRPSGGEYQLHQATNLTAAGAIGGTFWGGLIGLLFLNPLLGAAIGAGAGALAGSATDYGIPDDFIREIGKTVPVGSGAVFILSRKLNLDKLLPRVEQYGSRARLIQTSLSNDDEARLRSALAGAAAAPLAASSVPAAGQATGTRTTADAGATAHRTTHPQPPHAAGDDDDTPAEPTAPPRL
ncbi:DUF1269 domain-containing protein [uncultured Paracoccus sp.]|uniref:DUF1269 domain-containing protein n=1 Tax=uncultured Paracoccus sp. TaxID=189685 RepID=UPI00260FBA9E|nr:DUF1269 domain-containing protein [uncultured Paracoccus sp.]